MRGTCLLLTQSGHYAGEASSPQNSSGPSIATTPSRLFAKRSTNALWRGDNRAPDFCVELRALEPEYGLVCRTVMPASLFAVANAGRPPLHVRQIIKASGGPRDLPQLPARLGLRQGQVAERSLNSVAPSLSSVATLASIMASDLSFAASDLLFGQTTKTSIGLATLLEGCAVHGWHRRGAVEACACPREGQLLLRTVPLRSADD